MLGRFVTDWLKLIVQLSANINVVPNSIRGKDRLNKESDLLSERKLKFQEIADILKVLNGSVSTKITHKSMATIDFSFELLPHATYSAVLYRSMSKKMLQGRRFGSTAEIITETEAYFQAKDKSIVSS